MGLFRSNLYATWQKQAELHCCVLFDLICFITSDEVRKSRKKKGKKSFAMREKFDNTASRIPGIHREVLCVSGDVYEANVCRSGQNNCNPIPLLDLSRLETFTMPQV